MPANFVATPNGYMDPACVRELHPGEHLGPQGVVERPDHADAPCRSPRYDHSGAMMAAAPGPAGAPKADGWMMSVNAVTRPVRALHAEWRVPGDPPNRNGQILYYFPGLENSSNVKSILQPVLAWNMIGRGPGWTIGSWNCCNAADNAYHSEFLPVGAGDLIAGDLTGSNCDSAGVCANWRVVTRDVTRGTSVTFDTTAYGVAMNWVFTAAFEQYGVTSCDQEISSGSITFTNLSVTAVDGTVLNQNSALFLREPTDPNCGFGFNVDASAGTTPKVLYTQASQVSGRDVAKGSSLALDSSGAVRRDNAVVSPPIWNWDIGRRLAVRPGTQSGYILDGWGGIHPFGGAPRVNASAYWQGWDIARGIALLPNGQSGYVLDGWGGLHPFGGAPDAHGYGYWPGWDIARDVVLLANGTGGYTLDGWGGVHPFGVGNNPPPPTPRINGYWQGWDIARSLTIFPNGTGYVLEGFGGLHAFTLDGLPAPPSVPSMPWYMSRDYARGVTLQPNNTIVGVMVSDRLRPQYVTIQ